MSLNPENLKWGSKSRFAQRCEDEDEADRLASINVLHGVEQQVKEMRPEDKLSLAIGLLLDCVDAGILAGWKISRPEPKEANGEDA